MPSGKYYITSESVSEGHPDKLCDQVSDAILDDVLRQDSRGRVACETFVTMGLIIVGGEVTTTGYVDVINIARDVVKIDCKSDYNIKIREIECANYTILYVVEILLIDNTDDSTGCYDVEHNYTITSLEVIGDDGEAINQTIDLEQLSKQL